MKTTILLALALGGCIDSNQVQLVQLKDSNALAIQATDRYPAAVFPSVSGDEFYVSVYKLGHTNVGIHSGATASDCLRLSASTTLTANSVPGTLMSAGSYIEATDLENSCDPP